MYIGCSGWNYPAWKNDFYKGVSTKNYFQVYSQTFDTCEINNTFYKFPKIELIKKWEKESPEDFVFTIKAPRIITYFSKFKNKDTINKFYTTISYLGKKLGCVLFQLPPEVKYDKEILERIVDNLDYNYKNVIEFRDPSWWNENVFKIFEKNKIIFCNISSPLKGIKEGDIHNTTNDLYIRFHGIKRWYDYDYSEEELKLWVKKIREKNPENLWVYFNNTNPVYNFILFLDLLRFSS